MFCFFFNDTATTEIYTLSLHDALPISLPGTTPGKLDTNATPPLHMTFSPVDRWMPAPVLVTLASRVMWVARSRTYVLAKNGAAGVTRLSAPLTNETYRPLALIDAENAAR